MNQTPPQMNQAQQHLLAKTIALHCPSVTIQTVYNWLGWKLTHAPTAEDIAASPSTIQEIIAAAKLVCELGQIVCPLINNLQTAEKE